jgi:hypothetical protein
MRFPSKCFSFFSCARGADGLSVSDNHRDRSASPAAGAGPAVGFAGLGRILAKISRTLLAAGHSFITGVSVAGDFFVSLIAHPPVHHWLLQAPALTRCTAGSRAMPPLMPPTAAQSTDWILSRPTTNQANDAAPAVTARRFNPRAIFHLRWEPVTSERA